MPSSVYVNGTTTRRPGVYASVDASSLGGSALTAGVMAVVGDFPELPTATPVRYNTANQLKGASPSYANQVIAKVIYDPANDDRVNGQPSAVYLLNGGTSTAAETVLNSPSGAAIKITSSLYGPLGNTGTVAVTAGSGNDRTVTVTVNAQTRVVTYTGTNLVTVGYTGTDADTATIDVRDTSPTKLTINQSRSAIPAGALSLATASWKWDGALTFTASAPGNHSLLVEGVRKDTGATFSSTLTFTASATPDAPLGFEVAAITALTWTPAAAETLTVSGPAFDLDLTSSAYKTIKDVADHIQGYSAQGWAATSLSPTVSAIDSINLDRLASTNVYNPATATLTADLYQLVQLLDAQDIIAAELSSAPATAAREQVSAIVGVQNFAGGTFTAGDATSVAAAYTAARTESIQIFAHFYTDLATQQALREHCEYMAGQGLGECNGWVGMAAGVSKTDVATRTASLNTRHVALAAQEIQITDHTGATVWVSPLYQSLMLAAMQASTPIGTPLTRKIANVLDVRSDSTWDADNDAEELLGSGLAFFTTDRLGFKVERSITTYQTDDNPVFSEVSANESLYTSVRDLRENLDTQIGNPAVQSTAAVIRALAKDRLRYQVDNDIIKAFNGKSLTVEDVGDVFVVSCEIAVIEPVNFVLVEAKVTRIPFSA